ncbi:hypothetical protein [Dyella sp. ASV21]|uniref:hypothetical protein n=1 Tax=Dyella sp. ASV21 TaxID=2795114 RepID=UPI0018EC5522|nr:hypothetical protein [Dyella sp. ASV21]
MSEELTLLKERATAMGIAYSPNIGLEALKAKVNAKLNSEDETAGHGEGTGESEAETAAAPPAPAAKPQKADKPAREPTAAEALQAETMKQHAEQMKLVRIRVTNLNPAKKDLRGEIFTVANAILGTVRKFVPYGEDTDNGYHVPQIIYNELKEKKFVSVKTKKGEHGQMHVEQRLVPEFALEVLPPLTKEELNQLARQQAAAQGLD